MDAHINKKKFPQKWSDPSDYYCSHASGIKSAGMYIVPTHPGMDMITIMLLTILIGTVGLALVYYWESLPSAAMVLQKPSISMKERLGLQYHVTVIWDSKPHKTVFMTGKT